MSVGGFGTRLYGMDLDLAVPLAAAGIWLAAGAVAEGLPQPRTAPSLRRRTGWLLGLTGLGIAALVLPRFGVPGLAPADRGGVATVLPVVSAALVLALTVRRLRRLRAGAAILAPVPATPMPPALLAGAAHPMVAVPVQVTAVATLLAAAVAADLVPPDAAHSTGFAVTAAVLAAIVAGVRHGLRHSRLAESAVTVRPGSARPVGVLHV
ncbi:hypothetical protein AB0J86_02160 [Micromonospora sp. NPDC049559]|uniref:hypothetical protein n=1 Tax=Micromonospora sp. NPDC049559 TaxID=3155923 RepID=UPI003436B3EA